MRIEANGENARASCEKPSNSNGCWNWFLAFDRSSFWLYVIVYRCCFFSLSFCISHSFWLCSSSQNHLVKLLALYYCALPFNFQPILQTQYTISYQVQIKVNNIPVCRSLCDFSAWVCLCYTYTLFSVYFFRWICAFFCTSFRCFNTNGTLFLSLTLSRIFVMNSSASRT